MDYLNELAQTDASIMSYGDGQIMMKTKLGLHVQKVEQKGFSDEKNDVIRDDTMETVANSQRSADVQQVLDSLSGERFTERLNTSVACVGTIYGSEQAVIHSERNHSYFGMNKRYLTTDGMPNETAIIKRLKELNIVQEVKEARLGRLYNSVFTRDFYDNASLLLYVLHTQMYLYRFWSGNKVYTHVIPIAYNDVVGILEGTVGQATNAFREYIAHHPQGVGLGKGDVEVSECVRTLMTWVDEVTESIERERDDALRAQLAASAKYDWTIKVWKMYSYNDGHSRSGNTFGNVFGFRKNMFKKPGKMFTYRTSSRQCIVSFDPAAHINDGAADGYGNNDYFINCTSLTVKEVSILSQILNGVTRQTPFLADQTIDLVEDLVNVTSLGPVNYSPNNFEYTGRDLHQLLIKLINSHRWHEDYLTATRAAKYWLAQPATETVESHWWLHQERRLILPKLGLKRACFHFLIQDEGVCTTQQAIDVVTKLKLNDDRFTIESLLMNTYWYWGEFMYVHNKLSQAKLQQSLRGFKVMDLEERIRADGLVSAMIGKKIDLPIHTCVRTEWAVQLEEKYNIIVPFGTINFNSIADYGYRRNADENYILDTLVTPGCSAAIIGMSGTLMAGTPYSGMFNQQPAMKVVDDDKRVTALSYNDLWAYGVYCRWQGYNLQYKYPFTENRHVVFAANSVGVAMPPVKPSLRRTLPYIIEGVQCRQHQWGSEPNFLLQCKVTYAWNRTPLIVQHDPHWNAVAASTSTDAGRSITQFKGYAEHAERYVVALVSNYDIQSSGFQITMVNPGVPLGPDTEQSPLLEPGDNPDPPDPGVQNAPEV